mgnify:CR=1 FL=1
MNENSMNNAVTMRPDRGASLGRIDQYELIRELAAKFKEENGSIMCRDLLANCPKAQQPMDRTDEYYAVRPCVRLVMDAAAILDKVIEERNKEK